MVTLLFILLLIARFDPCLIFGDFWKVKSGLKEASERISVTIIRGNTQRGFRPAMTCSAPELVLSRTYWILLLLIIIALIHRRRASAGKLASSGQRDASLSAFWLASYNGVNGLDSVSSMISKSLYGEKKIAFGRNLPTLVFDSASTSRPVLANELARRFPTQKWFSTVRPNLPALCCLAGIICRLALGGQQWPLALIALPGLNLPPQNRFLCACLDNERAAAKRCRLNVENSRRTNGK